MLGDCCAETALGRSVSVPAQGNEQWNPLNVPRAKGCVIAVGYAIWQTTNQDEFPNG
jgi:hypothetical protein